MSLTLLIPTAWAAEGGDPTALLAGLVALVLVCAALCVGRLGWGLVASAVSGLALALVLTADHYAAADQAFCAAAGIVDCKRVTGSAYGSIAGVPVALIGAGYFAAVAFLAISYAVGRGRAAGGVVALAGLAVAYDVYLAWASTQLGALCPMCAATWALNVILLVGGIVAAIREPGGIGAALTASLKDDAVNAAIIGVGVMLVGHLVTRGPTGSAAGGANAGPSTGSAAVSGLFRQVDGTIVPDPTDNTKGPPDARFHIVEWADFECPYCGDMAPEIDALVKQNPDLKVSFRHYPISQVCNRYVEGERHVNACHAAAAAECAGRQGRFWDLQQQMFKNQEYLGKDDLRFMAEQVGLDMAAFEACMGDPAVAQIVKDDVEAGAAANLSGTPAVFLKGATGEQWVQLDLRGGGAGIQAVLDAARAGTLPPPGPAER